MFSVRASYRQFGGLFTCNGIFFLMLASLLSGCAVTEVSTARNGPLPPFEAGVEYSPGGYSAYDLTIIPAKKPFVGLAISGGGSRAAVFAWSVVEKLAALGILEHVDAISSVSGGSLAAATYVLNAHQLNEADDWDRFRHKLSADLLSPWLGKLASPVNWGRMITSDVERTHLMAEVFEERFFNGATFATLEKRKDGPVLLLNATLASGKNAGDPFVFSYETFADIGSRLDTYPISHAVMASGAFPGAFGNVTLKVFNDLNRRNEPVSTFVRVFDGGVADNLGLYTLLAAARTRYAASARGRGLGPSTHVATGPATMPGCLLISIDAGTLNLDGEMKAFTPDTDHSLLDLIVKGTAWDAINGLMNINRTATLQEFGQDVRRGQMRMTSPRLDMPSYGQVTDIPRSEELIDPVSSFPLFGPRAHGQQGWADPLFMPQEWITPRQSGRLTEIEFEQLMTDQRQWRAAAPQCKLWHINFERLRAMDAYIFDDGRSYTQQAEKPATAYNYNVWTETIRTSRDGQQTVFSRDIEYSIPFSDTSDLNEAEFYQLTSINAFRASLWGFVSRIGTSYRLTGVPHCKTDTISQQLVAAADVLVREDRSALLQVLNWFRTMELPVSDPAAIPSRKMGDMPRISTMLLETRRVGTLPLTECVP